MGCFTKNGKWLVVVALAALILFIAAQLDMFSIDNIVNYTSRSFPLSVLGFLAIYSLKAIVMVIPITVLYIAAGIVFSPIWAIIVTYICLGMALSIGYLSGKRLGEERVIKMISKQKTLAGFIEFRKDNLSSLCFVSRLIPLPVELMSMFYGALKMPFATYIGMSLLGKSPYIFAYTLVGASISNPLSIEFIAPFVISLILTFIVLIVYKIQVDDKQIRAST